jgi:hypothetical protein
VAGEGSSRERGLRPLSNSFPLSNILKNWAYYLDPFERGIQGVSILNQPYANSTTNISPHLGWL